MLTLEIFDSSCGQSVRKCKNIFACSHFIKLAQQAHPLEDTVVPGDGVQLGLGQVDSHVAGDRGGEEGEGGGQETVDWHGADAA